MFNQKEALGFATDAIDGGRSWGLSSLLSELLRQAEELFGPRDYSYTPVGVEFGGDHPYIWYPGNRRYVSIVLSDSCRLDPNHALFQLAHEVVHLLAPTGNSVAPVVEEGLACHFSDTRARFFGVDRRTGDEKYRAAMVVAQPLFDRPAIVRQLRGVRPSFSDWTPDLIAEIAPGVVNPTTAEMMCRPFAD